MRANTIFAFIAGFGLMAILSFTTGSEEGNMPGDKPNVSHFMKSNASGQVVRNVDITKTINFAGEQVPLHIHDVRERMDREIHVNTYYHSSTVLIMKRANRYLPEIEAILKKNGVPDDFKYLCLAESGLQNVTSPARAKGFWQFLEKTGIEYGLEINDEVDMRYDYIKSTEAACRYLKDAYERFGNWTIVAASYNMGQDGVARRLREQKVDSYYDLYLNSETSRYVFRILAFKEILSNPGRYGFFLDEKSLYEPMKYAEVQVNTAILDVPAFAARYGTNYKELKLMNPWMRNKTLRNTRGRTYDIKIPQ